MSNSGEVPYDSDAFVEVPVQGSAECFMNNRRGHLQLPTYGLFVFAKKDLFRAKLTRTSMCNLPTDLLDLVAEFVGHPLLAFDMAFDAFTTYLPGVVGFKRVAPHAARVEYRGFSCRQTVVPHYPQGEVDLGDTLIIDDDGEASFHSSERPDIWARFRVPDGFADRGQRDIRTFFARSQAWKRRTD